MAGMDAGAREQRPTALAFFLRLGFELVESFAHEAPVDNLLESLEILHSAILILQIVGVFPHVDSEERSASGGKWTVLVGRCFDFEFAVTQGQPGPTATEHFQGDGLKFLLQSVLGSKGAFDGFCEGTGGSVSLLLAETLPQQAMVIMPAAMIADIVADRLRDGIEVFKEILNGPRGDGGFLFNGLVQLGYVSGMMLVVMQFHRFGIDEGFHCVIIITQGWKLVHFRSDLCDRLVESETEGSGGKGDGF